VAVLSFAIASIQNEQRIAMHKLLGKPKEEFFAILPPTLFFFVALHIVAIIRVLMAKGSHFETMSTLSIAIGSLMNRYPEKPLVYNVAWKTPIYLLAASVIHYLERLIDFSRQAGGIVAGNEKLLAKIVWPHVWAVQILLFVLIGKTKVSLLICLAFFKLCRVRTDV
jgi:hypothetical protein